MKREIEITRRRFCQQILGGSLAAGALLRGQPPKEASQRHLNPQRT